MHSSISRMLALAALTGNFPSISQPAPRVDERPTPLDCEGVIAAVPEKAPTRYELGVLLGRCTTETLDKIEKSSAKRESPDEKAQRFLARTRLRTQLYHMTRKGNRPEGLDF